MNVFQNINYEYELIFINDASSDNSLQLLLKYKKVYQNIKIINMSRRFGSSACVIAGFSHSIGDAVIYMDVDLQDPPEIIPELIENWEAGFDVVHTTRTKRKGENFIRLWLTDKAYKIIRFFADIEILQNTGDFKLLSKRAVEAILSLEEDDPFLRGLSSWVGFKQTQVFYVRDARFAGTTKFPGWISGTSFKEFLRGLSSFSSIPLYFALFLGFIVSFSAFIYLVFIVISRFFLGMHLPGWPALMVTMLFLGGTILFTIGILGIYIGKIYQDVKNRPKYIVDNKIGFQ